MPQLRHALGDAGGGHGRASAAADRHAAGRPAIGGRPFGTVAMSAADILPPAPTPARKGGGPHWFRLVVIALILIVVVATLVRSTRSSHGAPEPTAPDDRRPAP